MFVQFGPSYFEHMSKVLLHNVPSVLAKILGAYSIKIKQTGQTKKKYVLIMENLNLAIDPKQEPNI